MSTAKEALEKRRRQLTFPFDSQICLCVDILNPGGVSTSLLASARIDATTLELTLRHLSLSFSHSGAQPQCLPYRESRRLVYFLRNWALTSDILSQCPPNSRPVCGGATCGCECNAGFYAVSALLESDDGQSNEIGSAEADPRDLLFRIP